MSAPLPDLNALLAPLDGESPSGADLVYDPDFLAMEQAAAGKPETQWSAEVPPDWPAAHELALTLARRTRDLRVAVSLLRSGTRLHGLAGLSSGFALVRGLLEHLWDSVHPQLDRSDGDDPTMRMNALAPLAASMAGLADLRSAALAPVRGSLTLRELELGLGRAEPGASETMPTETGVLQALQQLTREHTALAAQAQAAVADAQAIDALLQHKVGASAAPELGPMLKLLGVLAEALGRAGGSASGAAPADAAMGIATPTAPAATGGVGGGEAIRTRSDAARELQRVCEWIERNEPSNPAPLLIRRAQRLMDKNFLEIIRDLAPEGLTQVERIAGTESST
jgi:type VI secretion system protein ImpA